MDYELTSSKGPFDGQGIWEHNPGMKLKALAGAVGQRVPTVMGLQKKFELPTATEYPDGYTALLQKLLFLSLFRGAFVFPNCADVSEYHS